MKKGKDSPGLGTERDRSDKDSEKEYFEELFNFSCVLRGEVKDLEKIKKKKGMRIDDKIKTSSDDHERNFQKEKPAKALQDL